MGKRPASATRFFATGTKSGQEATFRADTATEALAKFYTLYEQNYLNVTVRDSRGKRLNRDDLIKLIALEKIGQHA
jgi:hypothetical protein